MLAEMIDRLLKLAPPTFHEDMGRKFSDKQLFPMKDPLPAALRVSTLTGLGDYLRGFADSDLGIESSIALHVTSHREVQLIGDLSGEWQERPTFVVAKTQDGPRAGLEVGFDFGTWLAIEPFIIGLQAHFHDGEHRTELLKLVSSMTSEAVQVAADDGMSQQVSVRRGVVLQGKAVVPNPIPLAPRRGFAEIAPIYSNFVFRVRQSGEGKAPECALFEGDGGAWQLEMRGLIAAFLKAAHPEIPVIS